MSLFPVSPVVDAVLDDPRIGTNSAVSVKAHGATGDGSTDDTAAIQAAIDTLKGNRGFGGTVFFPPGTYRITAPLQLSVGGTNATSHFSVRLLGAGPAAGSGASGVPAIKGTSRIYIDGAITGFEIGNTSTTEFNGPWFEHLVIVDKNGTATGGINLTQVDRWKIQDCTFWNFQAGYGVYTKHNGSIPDPLIQNCWFMRCKTGVLIQRADFLKIENCTFEAQISGTSAVQSGYKGIVADTSANLDTLRVVNSSFRNCDIPLDFTNQTTGPGQEITNCRFEVFTTAIKLSANSKDVVILGGDFNNAAVGTSGTALSIPTGALRTTAILGSCASIGTVLSDSGTDTFFIGMNGSSSTGQSLFKLANHMVVRHAVNALSADISPNSFPTTEEYVLADATTGNMTVNLPDVSLIPAHGNRRGQVMTIKKIDDSANTVTIKAAVSQLIEGQASNDYVLTAPGQYVTLLVGLYLHTNTSWVIVGAGTP